MEQHTPGLSILGWAVPQGCTAGQCPGRGPSAPAHSAGGKINWNSTLSSPDSPFMIAGTEASMRSHSEAGPGEQNTSGIQQQARLRYVLRSSPWFRRHWLLSLQQSLDAVVMSFPSGGREGVVSALI